MKFQNLCKIILISSCLIGLPALAQDEDASPSDEATTQSAGEQIPGDSEDASNLSKEIDEATSQDKVKNAVPEPEAAKAVVEKANPKPAAKKAAPKKTAKTKHAAKKATKKKAKSAKTAKAQANKKKH